MLRVRTIKIDGNELYFAADNKQWNWITARWSKILGLTELKWCVLSYLGKDPEAEKHMFQLKGTKSDELRGIPEG